MGRRPVHVTTKPRATSDMRKAKALLVSIPVLAEELGISRFSAERKLKKLAEVDRQHGARQWLFERHGAQRVRYEVSRYELYAQHPEFRTSVVVSAEEFAGLREDVEQLEQHLEKLARVVHAQGEALRRLAGPRAAKS